MNLFTNSKSVGDRFLTRPRSIVKVSPCHHGPPIFWPLILKFCTNTKAWFLLRPFSICLISSLRWCYNSCDTLETDWLIYDALYKWLQRPKSFHLDPDILFCCRLLCILNPSKFLQVFVFQLPGRIVYMDTFFVWMLPSEIGHHPLGKEMLSPHITRPENRKST